MIKNSYRNRTPVAQLFGTLDEELVLAEKLVFRFGWLRTNVYSMWKSDGG